MRVLVCGSRHELRRNLVWASLDNLLINGRLGPIKDLVIIQGCASGWDTFARQWAVFKTHHEPVDFPIRQADWSRFGRGAGPRRNRQMLVEGRPNLVVAGNGNTGTLDMINQSRQAGIDVINLPTESWWRLLSARYDRA